MDQGQRPALNMDLAGAVAFAARNGEIDAVKDWLATGGAPNATGGGQTTLLTYACLSSRPSCAQVAEILCAAGARDEGGHGDGMCLTYAALYGAVDTVKVLLSYGASVSATNSHRVPALHHAVSTNDWRRYKDPWSRANAQGASSMGHQGLVRLLLQHGAAVNARTSEHRFTPLIYAAKLSGFVSLDLVRELLAGGADLDLVETTNGRNAEAIARRRLRKEIYTGEGIPEHPERCRRPGAVEAFIELLTAVRAAGSWKRYANEPRVQLVVLRKLAESGRAVATRGVLTRLFAPRRRVQSIGSPLPDVLFWKILEFWRTDRDP